MTQIRWKLATLMLGIALIPLAITAWLDLRAMRSLGNDLAAQSAQALTDHARANLDQLADNYARLVRRDQQLIESLLRQQAIEIERLLRTRDDRASEPVFETADFLAGSPALDLQSGDKYRQFGADGSGQSIPVSFRHAVFQTPQSVAAGSLLPFARRLAPLRSLLADMQRRYEDLIYWQYLALDNGLHMSFPGHGGLPLEFDARERSWYRSQKSTGQLEWSRPVTDVSTRRTTVGVTLPLRDTAGRIVGVTGIDVLLTDMLGTLKLPDHFAAVSKVMVINVQRAPAEPVAVIVARKDGLGYGNDWRQVVEMETLRAPSPDQTGELLRAMTVERNGMLRMPYLGQDAFWVFRAFDDSDNYLMFIVPVTAAVEPALAAADYALRTTQRRIDGMLPLTLFVTLGVVGIALLVSRTVTNPIQQLSRAVAAVAEGEFHAKVDIRTGDELQRLGEAFNSMLPRLEEHARLIESLALAREVQEHLLPDRAPQIDGLDIAGASAYCDDTGGDYFDYLELDAIRPGLTGVVVGDVSGHGIPSALLMTAARALVHGLAGQLGSARQMFSAINSQLVQDFKAGRFMTLYYLTIDTLQGTIAWASAGHGPALHYQRASESFVELAGEDIPLGIIANWQFAEAHNGHWTIGDLIVLCTDGIWETRNPRGEEFGQRRLRDAIRANRDRGAQALCDAVLAEVDRFRNAAPLHDDITLIVIRKTA